MNSSKEIRYKDKGWGRKLLKKLEKSYNDCGFRTIIHTETGVDVRNTKNKVAIGIIVPSL